MELSGRRAMRRLILAATLTLGVAACAGAAEDPAHMLQQSFVQGMQSLESGDPRRAERIFREMLRHT